jgi:CRP/FNR family cyclic AMP-dependent transcriptional regulator
VSDRGLREATGQETSVPPRAGQEANLLKKKIFRSVMAEGARTVRVHRHCNIYMCGDADRNIYWIQSGYIKLVVNSKDGKECILDIYTTGDFFGESCLAGLELRAETATAMESSTLKQVSYQRFIADLSHAELLTFSREIIRQSVKQQSIIADMVTMSSEQRLGKTLLRLGSRLGKRQPSGTVIHCRTSHDELSCIVGTTRPRITEFMTRFRRLGLIQLNADRQIILDEGKLMAYLSSLVQGPTSGAGPILNRSRGARKTS